MSTPYYEDDLVRLFHGDAEAVARTLDSGSVQTIVTSPPYFGLRDYGEAGQIGAEDSLDAYVGSLVSLFRELRRVLADDGTLWLNLGDSYSSGGRSSYAATGKTGQRQGRTATLSKGLRPPAEMPDKNLLGVPWRVAFALQADGWILRSDIIWAKPNPMPESVTDRPTKAHEYVFLLAKSPRYYCNADAILEPFADDRMGASGALASKFQDASSMRADGGVTRPPTKNARNKRTVWNIATTPFPGAHFAVYPPELIRPCILAGSRTGDTVLDPFSGSGTTGMVATEEGRKYVGIDLNRDYLDLSLRTRFQQPVLDLTGGAA